MSDEAGGLEAVETPIGVVYRLRGASPNAIRCVACLRIFITVDGYLGHACEPEPPPAT